MKLTPMDRDITTFQLVKVIRRLKSDSSQVPNRRSLPIAARWQPPAAEAAAVVAAAATAAIAVVATASAASASAAAAVLLQPLATILCAALVLMDPCLSTI